MDHLPADFNTPVCIAIPHLALGPGLPLVFELEEFFLVWEDDTELFSL